MLGVTGNLPRKRTWGEPRKVKICATSGPGFDVDLDVVVRPRVVEEPVSRPGRPLCDAPRQTSEWEYSKIAWEFALRKALRLRHLCAVVLLFRNGRTMASAVPI